MPNITPQNDIQRYYHKFVDETLEKIRSIKFPRDIIKENGVIDLIEFLYHNESLLSSYLNFLRFPLPSKNDFIEKNENISIFLNNQLTGMPPALQFSVCDTISRGMFKWYVDEFSIEQFNVDLKAYNNSVHDLYTALQKAAYPIALLEVLGPSAKNRTFTDRIYRWSTCLQTLRICSNYEIDDFVDILTKQRFSLYTLEYPELSRKLKNIKSDIESDPGVKFTMVEVLLKLLIDKDVNLDRISKVTLAIMDTSDWLDSNDLPIVLPTNSAPVKPTEKSASAAVPLELFPINSNMIQYSHQIIPPPIPANWSQPPIGMMAVHETRSNSTLSSRTGTSSNSMSSLATTAVSTAPNIASPTSLTPSPESRKSGHEILVLDKAPVASSGKELTADPSYNFYDQCFVECGLCQKIHPKGYHMVFCTTCLICHPKKLHIGRLPPNVTYCVGCQLAHVTNVHPLIHGKTPDESIEIRKKLALQKLIGIQASYEQYNITSLQRYRARGRVILSSSLNNITHNSNENIARKAINKTKVSNIGRAVAEESKIAKATGGKQAKISRRAKKKRAVRTVKRLANGSKTESLRSSYLPGPRPSAPSNFAVVIQSNKQQVSVQSSTNDNYESPFWSARVDNNKKRESQEASSSSSTSNIGSTSTYRPLPPPLHQPLTYKSSDVPPNPSVHTRSVYRPSPPPPADQQPYPSSVYRPTSYSNSVQRKDRAGLIGSTYRPTKPGSTNNGVSGSTYRPTEPSGYGSGLAYRLPSP